MSLCANGVRLGHGLDLDMSQKPVQPVETKVSPLGYIFLIIICLSVSVLHQLPSKHDRSSSIFFTNTPQITSQTLSGFAFMVLMSLLVCLLYFQLFQGKQLRFLCDALQLS